MRIVQLLGPSSGGIRRTVATLTDGLRAAGHDVVTAGPAGVLEPLTATDVVVGVPPSVHPVRLVRAARSLRRATVGADVVHAHGLKAAWVALLAGRRPWVVTVHNVVLPGSPAATVLRALERAVLARADAVIATSPGIEASFRDVARRITTIRPVHHVPAVVRAASEVRGELAAGPRALVVCPARLHPQKGLDRLLDAWVTVPDALLVVVGDGPLRDDLTRRRDELGLADRVRFAGHRDDVADLVAAADLVVIPSYWESGPLVLLEALHLGRPVVTTRVGFVGEVVGDSGAAVVIEADADAAGLSASVAAVLADVAWQERLREAGPVRARPFLDPAPAVQATVATYRQVQR